MTEATKVSRSEEDPRVALGRYVRRARLAMGDQDPPSMAELARVAGVSRQTWKTIEDGEGPKDPSDKVLRGLAAALGRPYAEVWLVANESKVPEAFEIVPARKGEGAKD